MYSKFQELKLSVFKNLKILVFQTIGLFIKILEFLVLCNICTLS